MRTNKNARHWLSPTHNSVPTKFAKRGCHTRKTVAATCPRNMSSSVCRLAYCPYNMRPMQCTLRSLSPQHVPATCPRNMSPLHVPATYPRYMSPLHVPSVCRPLRVFFGRTGTHEGQFFLLFLNLSAIPTNSVPGQFGHIRQVKRVGITRSKIKEPKATVSITF